MSQDDDWPGGYCGGFWGVMAFFIIIAAIGTIVLAAVAID